MELRTTFPIEPSESKIGYNDPVLFIGSCFATSVGMQMAAGKMPVLINPAGTVYNPVSVSNTVDLVMSGREFGVKDLFNYNGNWLSFYHNTDFESHDPEELAERINRRTKEAFGFISSSHYLFITFGTARVYIRKKTGEIVSNCHKIPAINFEARLLEVGEIVSLWENLLDRLHSAYPELRIVLTISPVRHWKDGAHGNQVSKSVLFLAVEELLKHPAVHSYFPAYELIMDDLRDYRFYDTDMLQPSPTAIGYIWEAFAGCFLDPATLETWREIVKITKACGHRINSGSPAMIHQFAERMLEKIDTIGVKVPSVSFDKEKEYFRGLLNRINK